MKIHIITVGRPKLHYAKVGWEEYMTRLQRLRTVRTTHLSDKYTADADKILATAGEAYRVGLVIEGRQLDSHGLAALLR